MFRCWASRWAAYELAAALPAVEKYLSQEGIWEAIAEHEEELVRVLLEGLLEIKGVVVYGEKGWAKEVRVPVVSFSVEGVEDEKVHARLVEAGFGRAAGAGGHESTGGKGGGARPRGYGGGVAWVRRA